MDSQKQQVNLLNTWVDKVDMAGAAARIDDFIRSGSPHQVVTVNLDFLRLALRNSSFLQLINEANMVVADGMPLVWGARLQGDPLPERIAGVDLVCECARLAAEREYRVFLLGAAPGVAERAAEVLRRRYPGVNIVGTHAPPSLDAAEELVTLSLIHAAAPDILLVAFGAPRQEEWIRKHLSVLGIPVCIGVGGAFDMLSGRVSRAPGWMQRTGLEWFHRFLKEPGRLWKRYFVHDLPVFLQLLLWTTALHTTTGVALPERSTAGLADSAVEAAPSLAPSEAEPIAG